MKPHHVLILGNSLTAEAMAQILGTHELCVTIRVSTLEAALGALASHSIDMLLIVGTATETATWTLAVLMRYPNVPIMRSDLSTPKLQLLTSCWIEARLDQLLAVITSLPQQEQACMDLVPTMHEYITTNVTT